MSVARGTKIQWIQEELRVPDGATKHHLHSNRVTKDFSTLAPIDPGRIGGLKCFVEDCFPTYLERREEFRLEEGTIDVVLDAKTDQDFLESRGIKLTVALERLKNAVVAALADDEVYHMRPTEFDLVFDGVKEPFKALLREVGVPPNAADSMTSEGRFLGLNRLSFRKLLEKVAEMLDLLLPSRDLELFVACRNHLVHTGDFYCSSATDAERMKLPPHESVVDEYLFLIRIIDAFLLRAVGYRGPFLARRLGAENEIHEV